MSTPCTLCYLPASLQARWGEQRKKSEPKEIQISERSAFLICLPMPIRGRTWKANHHWHLGDCPSRPVCSHGAEHPFFPLDSWLQQCLLRRCSHNSAIWQVSQSMRCTICLNGHSWPRSPSKAAQKVWGSPAGWQNRAKHTCRVNLKGKRDLATCSCRGRQCGVPRLARCITSTHMVAKWVWVVWQTHICHSSSNCGAAASSLITCCFSKVGGLQEASVIYLVWSLKQLCYSCSYGRSRSTRINHGLPCGITNRDCFWQSSWHRLRSMTCPVGEVDSISMPHSFWRSLWGTPASRTLCGSR